MASKVITQFVCQTCGTSFSRWMGRCSGCKEWNSLVEEKEYKGGSKERVYIAGDSFSSKALPVNEINLEKTPRILTSINEFNHLLGGGLVPGSLILIGGDPGIGKSTLMLQAANSVAGSNGKVLYVSGEESIQQVRMRAERLGTLSKDLLVLSETNLGRLLNHVKDLNISCLIVDSIQTIYKDDIGSAPGSVSQVRECAAELLYYAKGKNVPVFLVGHVTKEGSIAGPRVLEHIVDAVLYFEGDKNYMFRLLRVIKNRFGPAGEIAVFKMTSEGLKEVANPSEIFLSEHTEGSPGSAVVCTMEGSRPYLCETQALVSSMSYGTPQRVAKGIDQKKLSILVAVLEKIEGYQLSHHDIFVNVVGGVKIEEPAIDLGLAVAIASSFRNKPLLAKTICIGELSLSGEVRMVSRLEERIQECVKLGYTSIILPKRAEKIKISKGVETHFVSRLGETLAFVF